MGRDKALLPHPEGGTWLERTLLLLGQLGAPISLLSRHTAHLALAQRLAPLLPPITALSEPPPCQGPLLALHRLMRQYPEERLLLCPVDIPELTLPALSSLLAAADHPAAAGSPTQLHLAHDGERLQPLLGVYPSSAPLCSHLAAAVERGERRLQGWLATQTIHTVSLDPRAIRNVNRQETDQQTVPPAEDPCSSTLLVQRPSSFSRSAPPSPGREP